MRVAALAGVIVIVAAGAALLEFHHRAGPYDAPFQPVQVDGTYAGTYEAVAGSSDPLGLCLPDPCEPPEARLELRIAGLPPVPYTARLDGGSSLELGPLVRDGATHVLRWQSDQDHTDKRSIVLMLAGHEVARVAVVPGPETPMAGPLTLAFPAPAGRVQTNEIGGAEISSVARIHLDGVPPTGWEFRARFEGDVPFDLGTLEPVGAGSSLDGRWERLPLEAHSGVLILLAPIGAGPEVGLPVLRATF